MLKVDTSDFENYTFRKDIAGDSIFGGYPISNLIKNENDERKILGGSNEIGVSRFDGLVVPVGLALTPTNIDGGCSQLSKIKMSNVIDVIDEKIFNNLFDTVKHSTPNNKTKKLKKK
jgi:hypothetical protein|tara:strand:- start:3861 stop:4211 length:351 start_codon:yes stop_codon:yes gene_type:complete